MLSIMPIAPVPAHWKQLGRFLRNCAIVIFLIFLLIGAWGLLDESGYIAHAENVHVYMRGDWMQNESRVCQGIQDHHDPANIHMTNLFCPFDESVDFTKLPHDLSIKFFGKTSRDDVSKDDELKNHKLTWRCERASNAFEGEHFTCYALN